MQPDALPHQQRRARRPQTDRKLRRSRSDRRLAGVCGGIAAFVDGKSGTVRLLYALSVPLSIGVTAVGYLLLWAIIPLAEDPPS